MTTKNQDAIIDALAAVLGPRLQAQYRATPSTPSIPYYTGPNSLFGVPGLERDVFSTRVQPYGLADQLPVQMTNVMTPMFAYFTGFLPGTGSEPNGVCDDAPEPGPGKTCIQIAQFGRFTRQTRTFEIDRLGQQINRGEFQDLTLINPPMVGGMTGSPTMPNVPTTANFTREVSMRMVELGVEFQNWFARKVYEGNPANNTGGGGYKEFPGLDILIGTTKVDALSGTPCPALASDIKDFNYANIGVASTGDGSIVNVLSYMMRYLRMKAEGQNMGAVNWVLVMRPSAFWELTAAWPCAYMTYRCQTTGGSTNNAYVDATDMIAMRDDMRNGNYIIIDGIRYSVILDNTIREDTNTNNVRVPNGSFASDIYVLPLSVRGNYPTLYWELLDYRTSLGIANDGNLASNFFWTEGGRYLWHIKPPNNWCIQYIAKTEPRLILRTPQLAGRLLNVLYRPLQHEVDPIVGDPYFVDGGVVGGRPQRPLYSDWNPVTPQLPKSLNEP